MILHPVPSVLRAGGFIGGMWMPMQYVYHIPQYVKLKTNCTFLTFSQKMNSCMYDSEIKLILDQTI